MQRLSWSTYVSNLIHDQTQIPSIPDCCCESLPLTESIPRPCLFCQRIFYEQAKLAAYIDSEFKRIAQTSIAVSSYLSFHENKEWIMDESIENMHRKAMKYLIFSSEVKFAGWNDSLVDQLEFPEVRDYLLFVSRYLVLDVCHNALMDLVERKPWTSDLFTEFDDAFMSFDSKTLETHISDLSPRSIARKDLSFYHPTDKVYTPQGGSTPRSGYTRMYVLADDVETNYTDSCSANCGVAECGAYNNSDNKTDNSKKDRWTTQYDDNGSKNQSRRKIVSNTDSHIESKEIMTTSSPMSMVWHCMGRSALTTPKKSLEMFGCG